MKGILLKSSSSDQESSDCNSDDASSVQSEASVSKTSEVLFHRTVEAISMSNWKTCTNLIAVDPSITTMSLETHYDKMNILHIIASHNGEIPKGAMIKILSTKPEAMGMADLEGNLPLHIAAGNSHRAGLVKALLKGFHGGVAAKNHKGDTPLHIAARLGIDGEVIAKTIIEIFPRGITIANNLGQLPIHSACHSESISIETIRIILENHYRFHTNSCKIDDKGDSPIHLAIKARAKLGVIAAFHDADQTFFDSFLIPDSKGTLPLHTALQVKIDKGFLLLIIKAAPAAGRIPNCNGEMPIVTATANNYPDDVIQKILEVDMPIDLSQRLDIVERDHGHSWWHVVINCNDRYLAVIQDMIKKPTLRQLVSLLQCPGPEEGTIVGSSMSPVCGEIFKGQLRKFGKYEIFDVFDSNSREITTYKAHEFGAGTFSVDGKIFRVGNDDSGTSSELLIQKRKVSLRLFAFEEDFLSELHVRKMHKISSKFVEDIISVHEGDISQTMMENRKLFGIAFECPDHTLADVFQRSDIIAKGQRWMDRCRVVLKHIADGMKFVHQRGILHGELTPNNIGKFGDTWKIMGLGISTSFGHAMRGTPHHAIPPESVTSIAIDGGENYEEDDASVSSKPLGILKGSLSGNQRVKFHEKIDDGSRDNDFGFTDEEGDIDDAIRAKDKIIERLQQTIEEGTKKIVNAYAVRNYECSYSPERCLAGPTWDIWAFGLIMAQLIIGQSHLVPNKEMPIERLLLILNSFDEHYLENLKSQVNSIDGKIAADLLAHLLHPLPEERVSTMSKILKHKYFVPTKKPETSQQEKKMQSKTIQNFQKTVHKHNSEISKPVAPIPSITSGVKDAILEEPYTVYDGEDLDEWNGNETKAIKSFPGQKTKSKSLSKNRPLSPFRTNELVRSCSRSSRSGTVVSGMGMRQGSRASRDAHSPSKLSKVSSTIGRREGSISMRDSAPKLNKVGSRNMRSPSRLGRVSSTVGRREGAMSMRDSPPKLNRVGSTCSSSSPMRLKRSGSNCSNTSMLLSSKPSRDYSLPMTNSSPSKLKRISSITSAISNFSRRSLMKKSSFANE
uniref:Protein kinase domain-containing protein n=2 Tax=Corethron hystrix TaxID=216773 RepID=A0A7S1FUX9_9STRA|mmetsp:Transcript_30523/g.69861  ORF Transcript_30523/g.69861 Transcript_30523/m.69861 type:complete len:1071 (+) Transcript_30523:219-3431(+)